MSYEEKYKAWSRGLEAAMGSAKAAYKAARAAENAVPADQEVPPAVATATDTAALELSRVEREYRETHPEPIQPAAGGRYRGYDDIPAHERPDRYE